MCCYLRVNVHFQGQRVKQEFNSIFYTSYLYFLVVTCEAGDVHVGFQLIKKFTAFYGTQSFITAFTSARHLSLSWASSIQSITPHPTSWKSLLILSSIYAWVSYPQVSSLKPCIRLASLPYALHAPPISLLSILSPEQYWARSTDH
jgi:hypothetical protein